MHILKYEGWLLRVVVIGASGMIGSTMLRVLAEKSDLEVYGTLRSGKWKKYYSPSISNRLISGIDVDKHDDLVRIIDSVKPDVVINCAGLTKHIDGADNPLVTIPINSLMPHRLAALCKITGARLIHISTDCVFLGSKGNYTEQDPADAMDIYGKSKYLGETLYPHTVTLRTSTIGHELESSYGLLNWFLAQDKQCKGYKRAIFSGLPTVFFAKVVRDIVIPREDLSGLYHVAGKAINKYKLLCLIAEIYKKSIDIIPDDDFVIDRSLNDQKFRDATGYEAPEWRELIETMYSYNNN